MTDHEELIANIVILQELVITSAGTIVTAIGLLIITILAIFFYYQIWNLVSGEGGSN